MVVEVVEFFVGVCGDGLLPILRVLFFLQSHFHIKVAEEAGDVPDFVGVGALGVRVAAFGLRLLPYRNNSIFLPMT
jgi:hypothetical protein